MNRYTINDKAYRTDGTVTTYRYKIEGNVLTVYFHLIDIDDKNRDEIYVRIES